MNPESLEHAIQSSLDRAVELLADFVAIPSLSARGEALGEGAEFTRRLLADSGMHVEILEADGAPLVFGHLPAPAGAPTLLIYGHYDVQPADPIDEWFSAPFTATLRDGALYGRGAGDNKGQLLAHIMAVRLLSEAGSLGVGIKFLVEGEEEIGSPHLEAAVRRHAGRLTADLALTSDAPVHDDGSPVVIFGVRGLLYIELECTGAVSDLHSGNRGGIAPAPALELVRAVASLWDETGRVAVPGYYDAVRAPDAAELDMLAALPFDLVRLRRELGTDRLPPGVERDPWRALMFEPNLNICGLDAGYQGPGAKTIVPRRGSCKLDVRLVADQDPDEIFHSLQAHLRLVAPTVTATRLASVAPSATPVNTPLAKPVIEAIRAATGLDPWLRPRLGGTTPDYVFTRILQIPSLLVPYGPVDMNHHAPNERMSLACLERGLRCSIQICERLANERLT